MFFEHGYGDRFGVSDDELAPLVGGLRSREELFAQCDVLAAAQAAGRGPRDAAARAGRLGLAALRAGPRDGPAGHRPARDAHRLGGDEPLERGRRLRPARLPQEQRAGRLLLGPARAPAPRAPRATTAAGCAPRSSASAPPRAGAVPALSAFGVNDVSVLTQRPVAAVAAPFASVRMRHFERDPGEPGRTLALDGRRSRSSPSSWPARHRRQLHPAGHRRAAHVRRRTTSSTLSSPGRCSSTSPATRAWASSGPGRPRSPSRCSTSATGLHYYAVDHSPSFLWNSATWENSEALLEYLPS